MATSGLLCTQTLPSARNSWICDESDQTIQYQFSKVHCSLNQARRGNRCSGISNGIFVGKQLQILTLYNKWTERLSGIKFALECIYMKRVVTNLFNLRRFCFCITKHCLPEINIFLVFVLFILLMWCLKYFAKSPLRIYSNPSFRLQLFTVKLG